MWALAWAWYDHERSRDGTGIDEALERPHGEGVLVGQGYVGLAVVMRAVDVGFPVVGYEDSAERVEALQAGVSDVGDVVDQQLSNALACRYLPSCDPQDLADFDVVVNRGPTPWNDAVTALSHIEQAGALHAQHLWPGAWVILESSTYPGTTSEPLAPILEAGSGFSADQYTLGYSPDRVDPGNPTYNLVNRPKVASGLDEASLPADDGFFATLVDRTVPVGSPAEADLVKPRENTFRHVNIALVNELALFARDTSHLLCSQARFTESALDTSNLWVLEDHPQLEPQQFDPICDSCSTQ